MKINLIIQSVICLIILSLQAEILTGQASLPDEFWKNSGDYSFMYFPAPVSSASEFHIQTNHHYLSFDFKSLAIKDLQHIGNPLPEKEAVRNSAGVLPAVPGLNLLDMRFSRGGTDYRISRGCPVISDCQLIESGKFFQRRYLKNLGLESGSPDATISMEIASWPDRMNLILELKPVAPQANDTVRFTLVIPEKYRHSVREENSKVLALDADGNGFLLVPFGINTRIDNYVHSLRVSQGILQNNSFNTGLILLPVRNYQGETFDLMMKDEKGDISLLAKQVTPSAVNLTSSWDAVHGWYEVFLKNDGTGNDRMERVKMELKNPSDYQKTVRINFHKTKNTGVFGITGISALIRDSEMNPTGLPVQLSKNWHQKNQDIYEGTWFRGFTMVTIPANSELEFEFTLVNALWGKLPAASHAQLSLVGWGHNQLWEESAIGAWGESVCYEPDGGQAQSMVCDVRPLMIQSADLVSKPNKWNWTPHVGGADFFRFYDQSGKKQTITRIKTSHKRNCPNLTEVTYAGITQGNEADYELTTSIYRSDDYVRAVYRIKLNVREAMNFSRLAIAQVGSESYSYTGEKMFALGDENGLKEEWNTSWGGSAYRKAGLHVNGNVPWISMHQAVNRTPTEWNAWANRGLIVRKWEARIAGVESKPYFSEYGAIARGTATSLVEINPGPGIQNLLPGDYVEAEIVEVIIPQQAITYYGPNQLLYKELVKNEDTWKPVFREAKGNQLTLNALKGTVLNAFPVVIEVDPSNQAEVEVSGGIGYVPFTFTGLTDYRGFSPKIMKNGREIELSDQEKHGKDYWQTDFDPVSKTWEITFSVPLDSIKGMISENESFKMYNDFGNEQPIPWSSPVLLTFTDKVANPLPGDGNLSPETGKVVRGAGVHASLKFQLPQYLDLSVNSTFKVKVLFAGPEPPPPVANIRLILRNNNNGSTQYALTQAIKQSNAWDQYVFNCSGAVGRDNYNQVYLFFCSPDNEGSSTGFTFYIDELIGPPISILPADIDIGTNQGGDSITIGLKSGNHKWNTLTNPVFVLYNNITGSVIKTDSVSYDSLRIIIHLNPNESLSGRDSLRLSFISGSILDKEGRNLPYFIKKAVLNRIPVTSFFLRFILLDYQSNASLPGINVSAANQNLLTNSSGEATFLLPAGDYDVEFSGTAYLPADSLIELNNDLTCTIKLRKSHATVRFLISDGSSPIQNASVDLNGTIVNTNSLGMGVFSDIPVKTGYNYQVSCEGFLPVNGSVYPEGDTTINLSLSTLSLTKPLTTGLGIYPVPAGDFLWVELNCFIEQLNITDILGNTVRKVNNLDAGKHSISLEGLSDGLYIIAVQGYNTTFTARIIKKNP